MEELYAYNLLGSNPYCLHIVTCQGSWVSGKTHLDGHKINTGQKPVNGKYIFWESGVHNLLFVYTVAASLIMETSIPLGDNISKHMEWVTQVDEFKSVNTTPTLTTDKTWCSSHIYYKGPICLAILTPETCILK